jgi:hypothetical protein
MSEIPGKAVVYAARLGLALQAQIIDLYVSKVVATHNYWLR